MPKAHWCMSGALGRGPSRASIWFAELSQFQPAHGAGAGAELACFDAHAVQHRDEEIRQRVVALAIEYQVLAVFEAAASQDHGEIGGDVGGGVPQVAAVQNHGAI